jgi:hypothetical protein
LLLAQHSDLIYLLAQVMQCCNRTRSSWTFVYYRITIVEVRASGFFDKLQEFNVKADASSPILLCTPSSINAITPDDRVAAHTMGQGDFSQDRLCAA